MTIYWDGTPTAIYWDGWATAVYIGDTLVWEPSRPPVAEGTLPLTTVSSGTYPEWHLYTVPLGGAGPYRLDTLYSYTVIDRQGVMAGYYRNSQFGGQIWTPLLAPLPNGEPGSVTVDLEPGESLYLRASLNGPGSYTIQGDFELHFLGELDGDGGDDEEPRFEGHTAASSETARLEVPVPLWATHMWLGGIAAGGGGSYGLAADSGEGGAAGESNAATLAVPVGARNVMVTLGGPGRGGSINPGMGNGGSGGDVLFYVYSSSGSTTAMTLKGGAGGRINQQIRFHGEDATSIERPDGETLVGGAGGTRDTKRGGAYGGGGCGGPGFPASAHEGGPSTASVAFYNDAWAAENL